MKIAFVSLDPKYAETLENEFNEYIKDDLKFRLIKHDQIYKCILEIKSFRPDLIIIDEVPYQIALLKEMNESNVFKCRNLVGLVKTNYHLTDLDTLVFVKAVECFDVVYGVLSLYFPEIDTTVKTFVRANYKEALRLKEICQVSSIDKEFFYFLTNRDLNIGEEFSLDHTVKNKCLETKKFIIKEILNNDVGMWYKYRVKSEIKFFDKMPRSDYMSCINDLKYESTEGELSLNAVQAILDVDKMGFKLVGKKIVSSDSTLVTDDNGLVTPGRDLTDLSKTYMTNWILKQGPENKDYGESPSFLIMDDSFDSYKEYINLKASEDLTVLYQADAKDVEDEIRKNMPRVIVWKMSTKNNSDVLRSIISNCCEYNDYFPFFVIFDNIDRPIAKVRDALQYHYIVLFKGGVNFDLLEKIKEIYYNKHLEQATVFAEKKLVKVENVNSNLKDTIDVTSLFPYQYIPSPGQKECFINHNILLTSINELEVSFKSNKSFERGLSFEIEFPIKLRIKISNIGDKDEKGYIDYIGIIFFVSDGDKKMLRKFIQSICSAGQEIDSSFLTGLRKRLFI